MQYVQLILPVGETSFVVVGRVAVLVERSVPECNRPVSQESIRAHVARIISTTRLSSTYTSLQVYVPTDFGLLVAGVGIMTLGVSVVPVTVTVARGLFPTPGTRQK